MQSPTGGALPGSPTYWRINAALFLAGFSTFSLLYCVQPLLPLFSQQFGVGPAESSLTLSLTTGFLAVAILIAGALSEGRNRKLLMFGSMTLAALCNLAGSLLLDWHGLLIARALAGLCLGGVPAVAIAYLAEEIDPRGFGLSVGLYVGGTAFGGMVGRIGTAMVAEAWSWHSAMATLSLLDLAMAVGFVALLPESRHAPTRQGLSLAGHVQIWRRHLAHPSLLRLFVIGFLSTGVFVTVFNYIGFRLMAPPFLLSATQISLVFCAYVFGIASSSIAGGLADRLGQAPVQIVGVVTAVAGVLLSLIPTLGCAIGSIALITIGFFIVHSVTSGWVGRLAGKHKGHAASLHLLAYYMGSSILSLCGGWFWERGGWGAVCVFALAALSIMLACSLHLRLTMCPSAFTSRISPSSSRS